MAGIGARPQSKGVELHKMRQSVYEIIDDNNNQATPPIKKHSPRRQVGIDISEIDHLICVHCSEKPPSSPFQSPSAPFKTDPLMAPGIGGFNIDAPVQRARLAKGDITIVHMPPESPTSKLFSQAPLQAQRMTLIVESGESSLTLRLLAIVAIVGALLLVFRDEVQNQLSDRMQSITSLYRVSNAETSVR
jgi:hypothetical protein